MTATLTGEVFREADKRILVVVLQCCEEGPPAVISIDFCTVFPGDSALPRGAACWITRVTGVTLPAGYNCGCQSKDWRNGYTEE